MDRVYIVLDCSRVVGASARLQGAEAIRADESARLADEAVAARTARRGLQWPVNRRGQAWKADQAHAYARLVIVDCPVRDAD